MSASFSLTTTARKICILTSVHQPFDVRIFHKEANSLVKAGYNVVLVAQHDKNEIVEGISVVPLSKPKNRRERMVKTVWQAYRTARTIEADVYHLHDPELIPVGLLLRLRKKKVIYDVHEDTPRQTLSKHYLPAVIRRPLGFVISVVEWFAANAFNAVVSVTPKIAKRFPLDKTHTVQNFPVATELVTPVPIIYVERPKVFAYVGGILSIRGAVEMVRALELLDDISGVSLELAGKFAPSHLENTLRELTGWTSVNYRGQVSRAQLPQILGKARAGLVLFHPLPNHMDAQPNKMFEYMSASLPIIVSDFPLWRGIVDGVGCGLLVDPLNPKAIAEAMRWVLEHPREAQAMGQRGRKAVERTYNWDPEAKKLLDLYDELIHQ